MTGDCLRLRRRAAEGHEVATGMALKFSRLEEQIMTESTGRDEVNVKRRNTSANGRH